MDRILILGCSGSGKSTLARRLSEITGLPAVHLDQYFWRPGWVQADPDAWERSLQRLIDQPRWIMDGTYGSSLDRRLARADAAIFLDFPLRISLYRTLRRTTLNLGRTRADVPPKCPERFNWPFFHYILTFRRDVRPRILDELDAFPDKRIVLSRPADVASFVERVESGAPILSEPAS